MSVPLGLSTLVFSSVHLRGGSFLGKSCPHNTTDNGVTYLLEEGHCGNA